MTAVDLPDRGADAVSLTLVTPEPTPLHLFGPAASEAVAELLRSRGIALVARPCDRARARPARARRRPRRSRPATTVVLPPLQGPWIEGLPVDEHGFIPVDRARPRRRRARRLRRRRRDGVPDQAGRARHPAGRRRRPRRSPPTSGRRAAPPFRPVLRGLLLTGGAPLYLRAELRGGQAVGQSRAPAALRGEVSTRALWWPPGKVAGRYLAPYLATARPRALGREPLVDRAATAPRTRRDDATPRSSSRCCSPTEDERAGDIPQALHALDAAAALGGGVLPAAASRRRDALRAGLARRDDP